MNTFDLSLDLDKRAGVTQWVTMRQGDHDGTQLRATIYDHGAQVADSYTCRVSIRKPTDNEYYRETCSFSGGVAIVTIDEQYAASEVGITYGYFELLQGTAVIASTENFGVRILQSAIDGAIVAPPYDSAIEDALAELDEATGRISQMVQDATAEYLEAHPELTTTVEDNSLTDAKLIQKGGILQREQWLESLVPVLKGITKETAEADVHSVTDSAGGGPLGIEVYGRSTQDGTPTPDAPVAIQSVTPQLLDPTGISASSRGLTATYEGQGWFRVSGTATGSSAALLLLWGSTTQTQYMLPAGSYAFTYEAEGIPTAIQFQCLSTVGSDTNRPWQVSMSSAFTMSCDGISRVCLLLSGGLAAGTVVDGRVRFSCYEGSTPHGWGNEVGLTTHGRNLLNPQLVYEGTLTTIERSDDGFRVRTAQNGIYRGASTGVTVDNRVNTLMALGVLRMGQTYTLSADVTVAAGTGFFAFRRSGTNVIAAMSAQVTSGTRHLSVTYTVTEDVYLSFFVTAGESAAGDVTFSNVQLELGGTEHAYQPYTETTIPIDLGGRSLRSLPDGTRDEVTVDEWGHAVLIQRVQEVTYDGSSDETWGNVTTGTSGKYRYSVQAPDTALWPYTDRVDTGILCDHFKPALNDNVEGGTRALTVGCHRRPNLAQIIFYKDGEDVSVFKAWLAENPITVQYPLATPVTIDLGYLDPALLPAPDLTAYAVPSAPSVLRYGFDVAAAIAEIATS